MWETERPFELHLDGVTVSGRADVILDQEGGVPTALAIVDYKTSTVGDALEHALQLQVYADAGRREGLDVRAAYVHDLKATTRDAVAGRPARDRQRRGDRRRGGRSGSARASYTPNPGLRCRRCEVRTICAVRRSADGSDLEDLHHLVAVVVDHLDRDLAGLGRGNGRDSVAYRTAQASSSMSALSARLRRL